MQQRIFLFPILLAITAGCRPEIINAPGYDRQLELVQVYDVEPARMETSGLIQFEGKLYTITDEDVGTIFRLNLEGGVARLLLDREFFPPEGGAMDYEGITVDPEGNFYLISEKKGRILKVDPEGKAQWISPDLRPAGRQVGLFDRANAGFEGITYMGPGHFLAAVERQPRGFIEFKAGNPEPQIQASLQSNSPFMSALPMTRSADYSGLATSDGKTYALFRGAHLVVRIEPSDNGWEEVEAWSYAHLETDPRWAFRNQTYGQAEGLVVEGNDVFIIFDNNRGDRMADSSDRRSLLLHTRFPAQ